MIRTSSSGISRPIHPFPWPHPPIIGGLLLKGWIWSTHFTPLGLTELLNWLWEVLNLSWWLETLGFRCHRLRKSAWDLFLQLTTISWFRMTFSPTKGFGCWCKNTDHCPLRWGWQFLRKLREMRNLTPYVKSPMSAMGPGINTYKVQYLHKYALSWRIT